MDVIHILTEQTQKAHVTESIERSESKLWSRSYRFGVGWTFLFALRANTLVDVPLRTET